MAKKKRDLLHPDYWLEGLSDDNPVQRWHTCQAIQPGTGREKKLISRLLELLYDPIDWDCGHYVAVEAFKAIVRLDKTGYLWLNQASEAIQHHYKNGDGEIGGQMIRIARTVMEPWAFLQWINQMVPTPDTDEHWMKTLLGWLMWDWMEDEELVRYMLYELDPTDAEQVWLELCIHEQYFKAALVEIKVHERSQDAIDSHINHFHSKIGRWTEDAPMHIRELALLEVEKRRMCKG